MWNIKSFLYEIITLLEKGQTKTSWYVGKFKLEYKRSKEICIYLMTNSLLVPMARYWRKIVGLFWLEIEPQAAGPENQRTQS